MEEGKNEYEGYLCVADKVGDPRFFMSADRVAAEQWLASKAARSGEVHKEEEAQALADETSSPANADSGSVSSQLETLMKRFGDAMNSFHPLIEFQLAIGPLLVAGMIEGRFRKLANQEFDLLDSNGSMKMYGVPGGHFRPAVKQINDLSEMLDGISVLPGASFLSLVAIYDSFFSDLLRVLLKSQTSRYDNRQLTISLAEVKGLGAFSDLVEKVIDDELDSVMRDSHSRHVEFAEDTFGVKLRADYDRWNAYIEVFERRNLVAHGNLVANATYLKNCKSANYDTGEAVTGDILPLDPPYLHAAVDTLTEFGLLLMFTLWVKNVPGGAGDAYQQLNDTAYKLIVKRRHQCAARVLDYALKYKTKLASVPERSRRMMAINMANAYKKCGDNDDTKRALEMFDWSATSDDFKVCIASLNENADEVASLMDQTKHIVGAEGFREWPVFDWVRDSEKVRNEFERVFGEPLLAASSEQLNVVEDPSDLSDVELVPEQSAGTAPRP